MKQVSTITGYFRTVFSTAIDTYILPGTTTGTEILWLYLKQWNKEFSRLFVGLIISFLVYPEFPDSPAVITRQPTEEPE